MTLQSFNQLNTTPISISTLSTHSQGNTSTYHITFTVSTHITVSTNNTQSTLFNTFFIIIFIDEYAYTSLYSIHTCGLHTCGFTTSNGTLETCGSFLTPPCRILDLCPFTILLLSIQKKKFVCGIMATFFTRQGTVFLHSDYILASLCRPGFVDPLT